MVINKDKTKIIKFSKSRKWDFPPELKFVDGTEIESDLEKVLNRPQAENSKFYNVLKIA